MTKEKQTKIEYIDPSVLCHLDGREDEVLVEETLKRLCAKVNEVIDKLNKQEEIK
jgi:predicted aspartyl protease